MIFTRGFYKALRVKIIHSRGPYTYYFLHDSPILIEKSRKFCKLSPETGEKWLKVEFPRFTTIDNYRPYYRSIQGAST
jgi:hypothetical protein